MAGPSLYSPFLPIGTEADSLEEGARRFSYRSGSRTLSSSSDKPRAGVLGCLVSRFLEDFTPETSFFLFCSFSLLPCGSTRSPGAILVHHGFSAAVRPTHGTGSFSFLGGEGLSCSL